MRLDKLVCAALLSICAACDGGGGDTPTPDGHVANVTPAEACDELTAAICKVDYACFTADELMQAGYPADEAGCVSQYEASNSCAAQTAETYCPGSNQTFHADQVPECIAQINGLKCSDVRDPNFDVNATAPACGRICAVN